MNAPKTYRKKPVVVQAMQYTGSNNRELIVFAGADNISFASDKAIVETLEGPLNASIGDFIIQGIQGIKGEFYPCKPGVFAATYEEVSKTRHTGRPVKKR